MEIVVVIALVFCLGLTQAKSVNSDADSKLLELLTNLIDLEEREISKPDHTQLTNRKEALETSKTRKNEGRTAKTGYTYKGSVEMGTKCVFPFKYYDHTVSECTTSANHGVYWCSTTADYGRDGKWGTCESADSDNTGYTYGGNAPIGKQCVFPLTYQGVEYTSCAPSESGVAGLWCSTTENYGTDGEWGTCETRKTTDVGTVTHKKTITIPNYMVVFSFAESQQRGDVVVFGDNDVNVIDTSTDAVTRYTPELKFQFMIKPNDDQLVHYSQGVMHLVTTDFKQNIHSYQGWTDGLLYLSPNRFLTYSDDDDYIWFKKLQVKNNEITKEAVIGIDHVEPIPYKPGKTQICGDDNIIYILYLTTDNIMVLRVIDLATKRAIDHKNIASVIPNSRSGQRYFTSMALFGGSFLFGDNRGEIHIFNKALQFQQSIQGITCRGSPVNGVTVQSAGGIDKLYVICDGSSDGSFVQVFY